MNINKKIFPETLLQLMLDVLGKTSRFTYIDGTQPFLMTFDGQKYYVYVKNLSSAYFKDRPDTTRAQLPIKDEFDEIKNSPIPFIFLGYDQVNDVLVCWNYHVAKERLNEKKSVSFYSRQFFQDEVYSGELMRKTLKNGDEPILFKRKDLVIFFSQINSYFPKKKILQIKTLLDNVTNQELEPVIELPVTRNITGSKILNIIETDLIKQLKPIIESNHTFEAMKIAERYYNGQYSAMRPKDWLALIKGIDFGVIEKADIQTDVLFDSHVAAEPYVKYVLSKSNETEFVSFMQNTGLSKKSINNYVAAIYGRISEGIRSYLYADLRDIFAVSDIALLSDWHSKLFQISEFKTLDRVGKNMYSCALKKYIQFLEYSFPQLESDKFENPIDKAHVLTHKTNELQFLQYLIDKGLSENSAKYYVNAMGGKVADCIRLNINSELLNLYSVVDYYTVFDWSLILYRIPQFKELDSKGNRQYSCALKHYLEYLYSTNNMELFYNEDVTAIPESGKRKSVILRVTYPDGRIVEERVVSSTLIDVVLSAGAKRVQSLGIMLNGTNIVSNTILPKYATSQKPIGNNLYVMTCCDTNKKQSIIEKISECLNLDLKIERINII